MATHSSILAWEIPQTEEPGGLQSMGSQRVRHDQVTDTYTSRQKRMSKCGTIIILNLVNSIELPFLLLDFPSF